MAWTEQDYQEIEDELKKDSQGVGDVPEAESLDGITSLPAYQEKDGEEIIVRAPLELLAAPALEAADKANEAADKAESNATAAQTAANTANEKAELAAQAASDVNAAKEGAETAAQSANTAASNANEKAVLADTAAANANDTAEHPTYIGQDHYVYKWNKTAQAYDKTDIYTKGDAFSIKKVYASVANMEADKSNPDITEGDFVLVNTGDVEDPDNAKLYVKADGDFEFLVDMSGAIGFTGKTPQFSMGTISTLEAGSTATATISEDGVDSDGNPKYKINFAIPRGNPGAPFRISGEYATLEALKSAVPDGSTIDGFMAVGTEAPYDYYAWVNGDWVNQGKIAGGGSGNVVVIPSAVMSLSDQATSDEIFNAFGGKDAFMDICQSIINKDTVCVVANIPEESGMKIVYIPAMAMATYTDANNANLMIAIITQTTFQLGITVTDGIATKSSQVLNHIYEAPSDGNVYGRKNGNWAEVSDKKYVDDSISSARSVGYMMQFTEIDASGLDENTWYPVTIAAGERMNIRVEVLVSLDSGTKPSWSTHEKGFSTRKIWEFAPNAWGVNRGSNITIYLSDFIHADIDPVRGLGNLSFFDTCYVFVRGGGKYHFYASHEAKVILHTDTFAPGDQSVSPTTETPAEIVANIATTGDVLTKTNTSAYTPTQHYHPATKAYADDIGYGRTITTTADKFLNTANLSGVDAEQRVIDLFGSLDNFKNVVANILANHVRYYFHFGDNPNNNCVELGCVNAWRANNNSSHELHFIITYYNENNLYTNRISIVVNNDTAASKVIIASLVNSDNLTTITKKTAAEYEAIGSKDANTAYCVTD